MKKAVTASTSDATIVSCGKKCNPIVQDPKYLLKNNYLGEFRTETEKAIARKNLGVGALNFKIVEELPTEYDPTQDGIVYFIKSTTNSGIDFYYEYIWINKGTLDKPDYILERFGGLEDSVIVCNIEPLIERIMYRTNMINGLCTFEDLVDQIFTDKDIYNKILTGVYQARFIYKENIIQYTLNTDINGNTSILFSLKDYNIYLNGLYSALIFNLSLNNLLKDYIEQEDRIMKAYDDFIRTHKITYTENETLYVKSILLYIEDLKHPQYNITYSIAIYKNNLEKVKISNRTIIGKVYNLTTDEDITQEVYSNNGYVTFKHDINYILIVHNIFTGPHTNVEEFFKDCIDLICIISRNLLSLDFIDSAFENCSELTHAYIKGPYVEASKVFKNCGKLKYVSYLFLTYTPNTLELCFYGCTSLINIPIPPSIYISSWPYNITDCFNGCTNLSLSTPITREGKKLWEYSNIDGNLAFRGCDNLLDYNIIPENWK